jgi:RNA polymerase sigma-70 factor (ECF subfamily)
MDEARFKIFFELTAKPLRSYILSVSRDKALSDDVFQETYVRFLQSESGPVEDAKMKSYLFAIATNILRDQWRHVSRWQIGSSDENEAATHEHHDADMGDRHSVEQALAKLTPRERSLVWLAYAEGYQHKEIAGMLHVGERSVRVLLFRAKQKLAKILDGMGIPEE